MKRIQKLSDIEGLKQTENLPAFYIEVIREQFIGMFEADGDSEPLGSFSLPNYACIYHLNEIDDQHWLFHLIELEQVEFIEEEKEYFCIGIMQDHQMNMVYFLKGTLPAIIEKWLSN